MLTASCPREVATTSAPAAAIPSESARPIPSVPPTTTAVFPVSGNSTQTIQSTKLLVHSQGNFGLHCKICLLHYMHQAVHSSIGLNARKLRFLCFFGVKREEMQRLSPQRMTRQSARCSALRRNYPYRQDNPARCERHGNFFVTSLSACHPTFVLLADTPSGMGIFRPKLRRYPLRVPGPRPDAYSLLRTCSDGEKLRP